MSKVALITGASKGIGAATATALAGSGYDIIINYNHDQKSADLVANEVEKLGKKATVIKADIVNREQVDEMFKQIEARFKNIDLLVNNAGIFDEEDSPDNLDAFERIFKTNFLAQVDVTNHARKIMTKGKIVFISSIHGKLGNGRPTAIAYSAQKAALNSYMKNLAKALAPDILVNAIAPGRTITPMWGEMDDKYKHEMASGQLIKRWIEPAEIADAVVFLAKNDAVCGEVLTVDGGMSLVTLG